MFNHWKEKRKTAIILRKQLLDIIGKTYGGDQRESMLKSIPPAWLYATFYSLERLEELVLNNI
jgi:hypothetical protein